MATLLPSSVLPSVEFSSGLREFRHLHQHHSVFQQNNTPHPWELGGPQSANEDSPAEAPIQCPSKAMDYSIRMSWSALSKLDAWISYFAVFLPMMTYTLPVCHHSQKSLQRLQSAPTGSTLLKLGFNRHTAYAVVYGSVQYAGLDLRPLFIEQGIPMLLISMRHL
jgi:hypothetical protein